MGRLEASGLTQLHSYSQLSAPDAHLFSVTRRPMTHPSRAKGYLDAQPSIAHDAARRSQESLTVTQLGQVARFRVSSDSVGAYRDPLG